MNGNREFYPSKTPDDRARMETVLAGLRQEVLDLERSPGLQKRVDSLDASLIRENLRRIVEHCGIDPEKMHQVTPEAIVALADSQRFESPGQHSTTGDFIVLNERTLESNREETGLSLEASVAWTVIHEQIHAASYTKIDPALDEEGKRSLVIESGYGVKRVGGVSLFEQFDEGVNDKLAIEQTLEYAKTHPETLTLADKEKLMSALPLGPYKEQILLVKCLTMFVSKEAQVSPETVWQGIVRGKFSGEGLYEPEVAEWFQEHIAPDFLDRLKSEETDEGIEKLTLEVFRKYRDYILSHVMG